MDAKHTPKALAEMAAQVAEQRAYIELHFPNNDPAGMQSGISVGTCEAALDIATALYEAALEALHSILSTERGYAELCAAIAKAEGHA